MPPSSSIRVTATHIADREIAKLVGVQVIGSELVLWQADGGPVPVLRCEPGDSLELPAAIAALALLARASAWQRQTDAAA